MARRKTGQNRFGGNIFFWFFCVFTILGLSGVVAWLSLTPKNPEFEISNLQFPSSNSSNTSTPLNSVFFDLKISNPNKRMAIYYSDINLHLYWNGGVVGTTSTPGFYQGHKDVTSFKVLIRADQEFWKRMNFDFITRVDTAVKFRIFKWKTKVRDIEYEAQFSNVTISVNGTALGGNYRGVRHASKEKIRD